MTHQTESANMIRPILTLPPKIKTLAQQNVDFTAEGAPPPGTAAISIPGAGYEFVKPVLRSPTIVIGAHKHRPSAHNR